MKNYEIRRHGGMHKAYEKGTKQYVACSIKHKRIKDLVTLLENGSGFAGNTPKYLLAGLRHGIELDHRRGSVEY